MFFAKKASSDLYSPNLFLNIAKKLYSECGIEHINDIKKDSAIFIFHGVRRNKKNRSEEKHVLVKVLLSKDERNKVKFDNEAFYYNQFNHDHLIRMEFSRKINFGYKIGKKNCIVLEYVEGVDLELVINSMAVTQKQILEATAIDIIIKTLSALHEVHNLKDRKENNLNIVHADISPHNVLLSKKGQVKLIDFGISVIKDKQEKIKKNVIDGKISYMSPEQILGENIDQRTDIFSIGIVLAEMLLSTKLNPTIVRGDKVKENAINANYPVISQSDLDVGIKKILAKALSKDPENRYQTALEMIKALENYKEKKGLMSRLQDITELVETIYLYVNSGKTAVSDISSNVSVKQALLSDLCESASHESKALSFNLAKKKQKIVRTVSLIMPVMLAVIAAFVWIIPQLQTAEPIKIQEQQPIKADAPQPSVTNSQLKVEVDSKPVVTKNEKQEKKTWNPNIQISSPGAAILISTDTDKWNGRGKLTLKDMKIDDGVKEQIYHLKISKKGHDTRHINFTLTQEKTDYIKTITLQVTKYGTLVASADDIVTYSISGYANKKGVPFTLKLPQGRHKMVIKGKDIFDNNKKYVLYHTVTIKPDKTTNCMARVSEEKKFVKCE